MSSVERMSNHNGILALPFDELRVSGDKILLFIENDLKNEFCCQHMATVVELY